MAVAPACRVDTAYSAQYYRLKQSIRVIGAAIAQSAGPGERADIIPFPTGRAPSWPVAKSSAIHAAGTVNAASTAGRSSETASIPSSFAN